MKKKSGKKVLSKQVKKTLPYHLFVICLIILVLLIVSWVVLFIVGKVSYFPKDEEGKWTGELGTLKWDFGRDEVFLDVLNYTLGFGNLSIDVNINWSSGNQTINAIFVKFERTQGDCNVSFGPGIAGMFSFGSNYTILIDSLDGNCNCEPTNFTNVTSVEAFAQIHVNLTQTTIPLPDIIIYDDDDLTDIGVDLDDYFTSEVDINFSVVEDPNNGDVDLIINSTTNEISFLTSGGWYGTQKFNLTASEISGGGDVLDVSTSGKNMTFSVVFLDENRPIASDNNAPDFDSAACYEFEWEENNNYTIDMDDCWDDEDDDDLEYRYDSLNDYEENISIIELSGNRLKFVPNSSFLGRTYLYFYANDSIDETSHRVYIDIKKSISGEEEEEEEEDRDPKIKTSSPSGSTISIFVNKTKTFVINAENYETIKWYLDGVLVAEGVLSYMFNGGDEGSHTIKVETINGTLSDSKTWNLKVEGDKQISERIVEVGKVIFYSILVVVIILIMLVVWLFIAEKNRQHKKINYLGFGVSGSPAIQLKPRNKPRPPGLVNPFGAGASFNIPR